MANKVKLLQQWCKVMCDGYRDVEITNMTSSWKSGLAFCAIIHRYRPDLIDYDSLKKEDTFFNSKLAFDVALNELKIAALLDAEDMVIMTVPDKLCIITYVSQYYNYFHNKPQLGGPGINKATGGIKRPLPTDEPKPSLAEITNKPANVMPSDVSPAAKRRTIEDRCCMCREKVYLLERLYSGGKLYHRRCCPETERASVVKRNEENSNEKKKSVFGGYSSKAADNKRQDTFSGDASSAKNKSAAEAAQKPASTNIMKSLFVPSKYKTEAKEVSKVPATSGSQLPSAHKGPTITSTVSNSGPSSTKNTSAVAVTSSGASSRLSNFVPTSTPCTNISKTSTSNSAATTTVSSSKYLTPTAQITSAAANMKVTDTKPTSGFIASKVLSPTGKGGIEGPNTGKVEATAGKTEWQLEAERRQAARNGAYIDPEKNPHGAVGRFDAAGQKDDKRNLTGKELDTKKDDSSVSKGDAARSSAKDNITKILQRQSQSKKEGNAISSTNTEALKGTQIQDFKPQIGKSPQDKDDESGVAVENPGPESQGANPLSPQENMKKFLEESNIGFKNADRASEANRLCFESLPFAGQKPKQTIENPKIPMRKVYAEETISLDQIKAKLAVLDQELRVIESQGRELEEKIRGGTDEAMDEGQEDLMIEWFNLVKQKYEKVRDESDLFYRRRQQELEEQHEIIEYEYRCLSEKPDDEKTYAEKKRQKELLDKLVEIVNKRGSIVDSIEDDRKRHLDEDEKIESMMKATGINDSAISKNKKNKNKNKKKNKKRRFFLGKSPKETPVNE